MQLNYDFDMFSVFPDELFSDPKTGDFLKKTGFSADQPNNKIALFRDQKTVQALMAAPDHVRHMFADAGFGDKTYQSGAPDGFYLERDEAARNGVLDKIHSVPQALTRSVASQIFDVSDFLAAAASARPVNAGSSAKPDVSAVPMLKRKVFGFSAMDVMLGVAIFAGFLLLRNALPA